MKRTNHSITVVGNIRQWLLLFCAATCTSTWAAPALLIYSGNHSSTNRLVTFANTQVSLSSGIKVFQLMSTNGQSLNVTGFGLGGGNAVDFQVVVKNETNGVVSGSSFTIPAGPCYTVEARFQPSTAGSRTATINFNTDDPANASVALTLSGTGTTPTMNLADYMPFPLQFGFAAIHSVAIICA